MIEKIGDTGLTVLANITRLRAERRMTYVELSERLETAGHRIPVLALRRIERGERRVDVDDLVALAAVLDVTPAQLLEPPTECPTCRGTPPPGFACNTCEAGTSGS